MFLTPVALGIITRNTKEFLVSQRQSHQSMAGLWEFPGGKMELDETLFQALQRELQEEIGIQVESATPFFETTHIYPRDVICLKAAWVNAFQGEPYAKENQILRWVTLEELITLDFPEANSAIIQMIQRVSSKSNNSGISGVK